MRNVRCECLGISITGLAGAHDEEKKRIMGGRESNFTTQIRSNDKHAFYLVRVSHIRNSSGSAISIVASSTQSPMLQGFTSGQALSSLFLLVATSTHIILAR